MSLAEKNTRVRHIGDVPSDDFIQSHVDSFFPLDDDKDASGPVVSVISGEEETLKVEDFENNVYVAGVELGTDENHPNEDRVIT